MGTACTENSLPWLLEKSRIMKKSLLFLFVCAVFSLSAQSEQRAEVIQADAVQSAEDLSVAENTTKPVQAKKASCCSKKSNASSCSSSKSAKVETSSTEANGAQTAAVQSPAKKKACCSKGGSKSGCSSSATAQVRSKTEEAEKETSGTQQ